MLKLTASAVLAIAVVGCSPVSAEYLGNLSNNQFDPNSTSNPYGRYGNPYSPDSINNPYGKYGSSYSDHSANNPYATHPPKLYENDGGIGVYSDD